MNRPRIRVVPPPPPAIRVGSPRFLLLSGLLALATTISRLLTRAHEPYGWDAFNFVLGVRHMHPMMDMPHFPGYPYRMLAGQLLYSFFAVPHTALVVWSALLAGTGVALLALFGARKVAPFLELQGRDAEGFGLLAAFLVAIDPMAWHYGSIALSNVSGIVASVIAAWAILNTRGRETRFVYTAFLIGVLAGFRLEVALLGFLWYKWSAHFHIPLHWLAVSLVAGICGLAVWMVPVGWVDGSVIGWWQRGMETFAIARRESLVLGGGHIHYYTTQILRGAAFTLFAFGFGVLPLLVQPLRSFRMWRSLRPEIRGILLWWLLPTFLVLYLGHLQPGYFMVLEPAFALVVATLLVKLYGDLRTRRLLLAGIALVSLLYFLVPLPGPKDLPFSFERIRANDTWLDGVRKAIKDERLGETTAFIHYSAEIYPWRAAMLDYPTTPAFQVLDSRMGRALVKGVELGERDIPVKATGPLDTLEVFSRTGRILVFGPVDGDRLAEDFPAFMPVDTLSTPHGAVPVLVLRPDSARFPRPSSPGGAHAGQQVPVDQTTP